jgi:hypothetical protein
LESGNPPEDDDLMATIVKKPSKSVPKKKTSDERKAALELRTMRNRGTITLCVHGINEKYCKTCLEKSAAKSAKKAKPVKEN